MTFKLIFLVIPVADMLESKFKYKTEKSTSEFSLTKEKKTLLLCSPDDYRSLSEHSLKLLTEILP